MGPAVPAGREGSGWMCGIRIGFSRLRQSSVGSSGISTSREVSPSPWLNQSRIMNCSHAAASVLMLSAGRNVVRVNSRRLTTRGLGSRSCSRVTGSTLSSGMLRPNRAPAMPIVGWSRSLWEPSVLRATRCSGVRGAATGPPTMGTTVDGSCRFFFRRVVRRPARTDRPAASGSLSQPTRWSTAWATWPYTRQNRDFP